MLTHRQTHKQTGYTTSSAELKMNDAYTARRRHDVTAVIALKSLPDGRLAGLVVSLDVATPITNVDLVCGAGGAGRV